MFDKLSASLDDVIKFEQKKHGRGGARGVGRGRNQGRQQQGQRGARQQRPRGGYVGKTAPQGRQQQQYSGTGRTPPRGRFANPGAITPRSTIQKKRPNGSNVQNWTPPGTTFQRKRLNTQMAKKPVAPGAKRISYPALGRNTPNPAGGRFKSNFSSQFRKIARPAISKASKMQTNLSIDRRRLANGRSAASKMQNGGIQTTRVPAPRTQGIKISTSQRSQRPAKGIQSNRIIGRDKLRNLGQQHRANQGGGVTRGAGGVGGQRLNRQRLALSARFAGQQRNGGARGGIRMRGGRGGRGAPQLY
eukprot:GHVN01016022.1.p1 GENE.GHVN01016022.1~~GHVN01016022.1.p1  ORF type:complete len:303 (+),score=25.40 GHVN01016022.1:51-959(+)